MSTFRGWTVYAMPTDIAPKDIKPKYVPHVAISRSPFTNVQQTQDWGGRHMELSISMPPMSTATGQTWVNWLMTLNGVLGVFQFSAAWVAQAGWTYPAGYSPTGYWRLKPGQGEWSVSDAHIYGLTFEIEEAA